LRAMWGLRFPAHFAKNAKWTGHGAVVLAVHPHGDAETATLSRGVSFLG
jgi:hypothetical protein